MLTRFVSSDSEIPVRHEPTIGADFRVSEVQVNDITLTLQIWDTAGDKKMLSIGKSLYKNADGIVLVYDITSRASFKNLDIYWDNFLKYSGMDEAEFFPAVLVGNKSDLSDKREVSLEEASFLSFVLMMLTIVHQFFKQLQYILVYIFVIFLGYRLVYEQEATKTDNLFRMFC